MMSIPALARHPRLIDALEDAGAAPHTRLPPILEDLERSGAITPFQAHLLAKNWPYLREDWASNLFLRSIKEHTRAYIDQARLAEIAAKEKELVA
jgi:hypothetical protein